MRFVYRSHLCPASPSHSRPAAAAARCIPLSSPSPAQRATAFESFFATASLSNARVKAKGKPTASQEGRRVLSGWSPKFPLRPENSPTQLQSALPAKCNRPHDRESEQYPPTPPNARGPSPRHDIHTHKQSACSRAAIRNQEHSSNLDRMHPIAELSNDNGAKPAVSPPAPAPRCTSSTLSAPRPREKLPATRPLAAAFFSPSGASKCTTLRKAACDGLTGPTDGGDRASAMLVRIRTELLSADGAARKRFVCSCACGRRVVAAAGWWFAGWASGYVDTLFAARLVRLSSDGSGAVWRSVVRRCTISVGGNGRHKGASVQAERSHVDFEFTGQQQQPSSITWKHLSPLLPCVLVLSPGLWGFVHVQQTPRG